MIEPKLDRSWIEINLDAIDHNLNSIRNRVSKNIKILGVVKADAYGHGALEVSRFLVSRGVDMLGVTTVQEGQYLREHGIAAPILVFGPFLPAEAEIIADNNLIATVADMAAIKWLEEAIKKGKEKEIAVHLKVETGMGRLGFWPEDGVLAAVRIKETPGLVLEGVYSHLATAMTPNNSYTQKQIGVFKNFLAELKKSGITGFTAHLANSGAIINYPQAHFDMVRAGTILYGQATSGHNDKIDLRDPWSLRTRVVYLKELPPGHSVGYGRTFVTRRKTRMALLPLGYVDGISMEPVLKPSGILDMLKGLIKIVLQYVGHSKVRLPVQFPGGKGYIIGKPGMQLTMVDVTGLPDIEVGTTAGVTARRTAISPDIPKVYRENGQIIPVMRSARKKYSLLEE